MLSGNSVDRGLSAGFSWNFGACSGTGGGTSVWFFSSCRGSGDTRCDRGAYRDRDQDVFYRSGSDEDGRSFFPECSGGEAGVSGGPDRYRDTGPYRSSADRGGKGSGDTGDLYSLWDQLTQASCKRKEDPIPGSTETCRTGKRIRISDLGQKSFCTFHTVSGSSRILAP